MPVFPCPTKIICAPGTAADTFPVHNLSAERDDGPEFHGLNFPVRIPDPTGTDNSIYTADGCTSTCTSTISQADADLCAAVQAFLCTLNDGTINPPPPTCLFPPCGPPPPPPVLPTGPAVGNAEKTATATCPDGSVSTYTLPANSIMANSQIMADTLAEAYAKDQANKNLMCLGDILRECCSAASYSSDIVPTGGTPPFTYDFTVGGPGSATWPPGFSAEKPLSSENFRISGSNAVAGNYNFTIRLTDSNGRTVTRAYLLTVVGLTDPAVLPPASIGTPYTYQFNPVTVGPVIWDTTGFVMFTRPNLPAGLTISDTGLITGTPTGPVGTFSFPVGVLDANVIPETGPDAPAVQCGKQFTLQVLAGACVDWTKLTWDAPIIEVGGGVATFTHSGKTFEFLVNMTGFAGGRGIRSAHETLGGHLTITGPAAPCVCQLAVDLGVLTHMTVGTNSRGGISIQVNAVEKAYVTIWANHTPGPYNAWDVSDDAGYRQVNTATKHLVLTFTVPAAANTTIFITDRDPVLGADYFDAVDAATTDCVDLAFQLYAAPDTAPP